MKTFYIIISGLILLFVVACDDDYYSSQRITGSGEIDSKSVVIEDFTAISLEHVANVHVETGKEKKVVFTAYENILPYMEAVVIGDELILRFNSNITVNSDEEIRINITLPLVNEIILDGVGNFYLKGPSQNSLEVVLDGVGNINATDLPILHGILDINGTGNISIDAKETLEVDIDGLGNVYYTGSPQLTVDINGLGEVIRE